MNRFPPAENGPQYELSALVRTMDDLTPEEEWAPRAGGVTAPLVYVGIATVTLLAFVGWLLFS